MSKTYKIVLIIIAASFALLFLFIFYFSRPVVSKVSNSTGKSFEVSTEWDLDSISKIQNYLEKTSNIEAFMAVSKDREILKYGEVDLLINLHSARKPIISLLIGIAVDKGLIKLEETIGELGISELDIEFTELEKSANIRHLLMAKSGIYLEADAQPDMLTERPQRGQYKPGEHYYYNNFDFNVLATILEIKTGKSYEQCLYEWLAIPLEMQEFSIDNVVYGTPFSKVKTEHPAYKTWMSARDFAKIGSMVAQKGLWKGKRLVSEDWINESTSPHHFFSKSDYQWPRDAVAYLWTIDSENGNIWGSGYGGQFVMIDTANQITLVQRHYTGNSLLSQGLYLRKNTQGSPVDLMQVWYALLRAKQNQI